jgi:superoxide dismutase
MIVLFLGGVTLVFNGKLFEGYFLISSSIFIKLLDIDFVEYAIGDTITKFIKLLIIFIAVIFSFNLIFSDLTSQPFYVNATEEQKKSYLQYEKYFIKNLNECTLMHAAALDMQSINNQITISKKAIIKEACGEAILAFEAYNVPNNGLPNNVSELMQDIKKDYTTIAMAIKKFAYDSNDDYDKTLAAIIINNKEDSIKKIEKLRYMLGLRSLKEENKKPVKVNYLNN